MQEYKVYATVTFNLEYEIVAENEDKAFEVADSTLLDWVERDHASLERYNEKTDYDVTDVKEVNSIEEDYECCCMKNGYAACEDCG